MHQEEVNKIKKSETQIQIKSLEKSGIPYSQADETDERGL